jgi:dienelactone hydrolase
VIFICTGRGMSKHEYTIIAEELASHGFTAVSVDMPYISTTRLLDGRVIKSSPLFRLPPGMLAGPYEKVDSFFTAATAAGTYFMSEVYSYLEQTATSPSSGFYKKIDMANAGVFGHSLGGRIAGNFISENKNIQAYISMEGIAPAVVRKNGIAKPMAYLLSESLVENAMTNYQQAVPNRKATVYIITLKDFGHNSFTDFTFTDPVSAKYSISKERCANLTRNIIISFFSHHLLQKGGFDKSLKDIPEIAINKFAFP